MLTPSDEGIKRAHMDKITAGITASSVSAVLRARQHNTKIISWKDGKIVEIDPHTIDTEAILKVSKKLLDNHE